MIPFFNSVASSSDGPKPEQPVGREPAGDDFVPGYGDKDNDPTKEPVFRMFQSDAPLHPHAFRPVAELIAASPTIYLSADAFRRMLLFVEIAGKEVGWLGTAEQVAGGDFLIDKVFLLEQEVTATETELSVDGQNKLVMELIEQGDQGLELANRLRFWGHSHVRMGTWPSFTDERTMERFGREGLPWYIRGIFNKYGRADFAIHYYDKGYRIKDVPWAVLDADGGRVLDCTQFKVHGSSGAPKTASPVSVAVEGSAEAVAVATLVDCGSSSCGSSACGSSVNYGGLPEVLRPSEQLRKEVLAEFAAKVTERTPPVVVGWLESLFGGSGKAADVQVISADKESSDPSAAPVPAEKSNSVPPNPQPTQPLPQASSPPPENKSVAPNSPPRRKAVKPDQGEEKGFWEWLLGL
ncbi:MAG: hypothetical protein K2W95_10160 [Candidatus Obscuribacterales bacterium]|nr:hypothetical protein [Candidatus Obscuribacterales bacterium]